MSASPDSTLADLRQTIGDLQRQLAERAAERDEGLAREAAMAEVLGVINSSSGDLAPVFEAILDRAMQLCGNDNGEIFRLKDGAYCLAVARGLPREYFEIERKAAILPGRETLVGRTALEARPVQIYDAWTDPDYGPKEEARLGGARTMLGVPLLRSGVPVGVIATSRSAIKPFTDRQIELVRTFAVQAVIAMENARLLGELRQRNEEIAAFNRDLEARVAAQVDELGRVGRLKRFLAPQLAEMIIAKGEERILESHRREIVVVFCDLRGYTAFTETAEPEDALDFLREYHGALGLLISQFEGTVDHFAGDGIMVFFNDPVPCPDPAKRAVKMAMAMRRSPMPAPSLPAPSPAENAQPASWSNGRSPTDRRRLAPDQRLSAVHRRHSSAPAQNPGIRHACACRVLFSDRHHAPRRTGACRRARRRP
jgi:adenylate cyclase